MSTAANAVVPTAPVVTISGFITQLRNNGWRAAAAEKLFAEQNINLAYLGFTSPTPILDVTFQGPPARWRITLTRTVEPIVSCVIAQDGQSTRRLRLTIPTCDTPAGTILYTSGSPCTLTLEFLDANGNVTSTSSTTVDKD